MRINRTMWMIQGLLALVFLFAGGMKLVLPLEAMAGPIAFPGWFMRFIGVAEVLGGLGLVLPGALGIHEELTPVAAAGLVVIMTGATIVSLSAMGATAASVPFVVGVLAGVVAYARSTFATTVPSF